MSGKVWAVGDTMPIQSDAYPEQCVYERGIDGRLTKPPFFPVHMAHQGRSPSFPASAEHVVTCTNVSDGGDVSMRCNCGATWEFNPNRSVTA